jgi:hypothetical protein
MQIVATPRRGGLDVGVHWRHNRSARQAREPKTSARRSEGGTPWYWAAPQPVSSNNADSAAATAPAVSVLLFLLAFIDRAFRLELFDA